MLKNSQTGWRIAKAGYSVFLLLKHVYGIHSAARRAVIKAVRAVGND